MHRTSQTGPPGPTRRRRTLGAVIAAAALLVPAITVATPAATRAAATPAAATPACGDVFLLGARGSGELGPGNPGWKPTKDDPQGLGKEVQSLRAQMKTNLPARTMDVTSLNYPAPSVLLLVPGVSVMDDVKAKNYVQAYRDYHRGSLQTFLAAIHQGEDRAYTLLLTQAKTCPQQRFILAGYSRGAMVIHRVLNRLVQVDGLTTELVGVVLPGHGSSIISLPQQMLDSACPRTRVRPHVRSSLPVLPPEAARATP
jgi:hypothetical protein